MPQISSKCSTRKYIFFFSFSGGGAFSREPSPTPSATISQHWFGVKGWGGVASNRSFPSQKPVLPLFRSRRETRRIPYDGYDPETNVMMAVRQEERAQTRAFLVAKGTHPRGRGSCQVVGAFPFALESPLPSFFDFTKPRVGLLSPASSLFPASTLRGSSSRRTPDSLLESLNKGFV